MTSFIPVLSSRDWLFSFPRSSRSSDGKQQEQKVLGTSLKKKEKAERLFLLRNSHKEIYLNDGENE